MSSSNEVREQIQKLLQPYILPREEVAYRRRILAAHLESSIKDGSLACPLGLVRPSSKVHISPEARGLHREYLEALNANISARAEYDKVRDELARASKSRSDRAQAQTVLQSAASNPLEEHLVKIRLQRKRDRLQVVEKHIAILNQKPAASATFLDAEEILKDTRPLPDVPRELVEGSFLGATAGKADLRDLIDKLDKQVLRAKLLLKSEEKLLDAVKARYTVRPETATDDAKLAALNATRTALINWMEAELSKVPGDEDTEGGDHEHDGGDGTTTPDQAFDRAKLDEQLSSIRQTYSRYLVVRKSLLQLVSQPTQPPALSQPSLTTTNTINLDQQSTDPPAAPPVTYLITPCLAALLSLSRTQKGLIAEKSHLNTTISRQLKETSQLLDHLAEESNLLLRSSSSSHQATQRQQRAKPGGRLALSLGLGRTGASSETTEVYARVKPWADAADEAKIATLEAVAEKIEEGQVALEGSMAALMEMQKILGQEEVGEGGTVEGQQQEDSDIWLAEERPAVAAGKRKHTRKETKAGESADLWAFLHGGLGGLNAGED